MWAWDARQQFGIAGLALAALGAIRRVVAVEAVGRVRVARLRDLDGVRAHLQRRRHARLPPAGSLSDRAGHRRRPRQLAQRPAQTRGGQCRAGLRRHGGDGIRGLRSIATPIAAPTRNSRISPRASNARNALLVSKMDWQLENVLLYSSRYERRDLAWVRLDDVLPHLPFLVRDNLAASRDLVLTADAAADVVAAYANEFPLVLDQPPAARPGRRRLAYSARHALRADAAAAGSRRPDDRSRRLRQGIGRACRQSSCHADPRRLTRCGPGAWARPRAFIDPRLIHFARMS